MATTETTRTTRSPGTPEAIYCLGVLGAWVWFWQAADGFWEHVWAIVQGIFWPAYLVYEVLAVLRG